MLISVGCFHIFIWKTGGFSLAISTRPPIKNWWFQDNWFLQLRFVISAIFYGFGSHQIHYHEANHQIGENIFDSLFTFASFPSKSPSFRKVYPPSTFHLALGKSKTRYTHLHPSHCRTSCPACCGDFPILTACRAAKRPANMQATWRSCTRSFRLEKPHGLGDGSSPKKPSQEKTV